MTTQHCGRLDPHKAHRFWARSRKVVQTCVCITPVCTCPEPVEDERAPRQRFSCPGTLQVEGAPAHMPTIVDL